MARTPHRLIDLTDVVPLSYSGEALKFLQVNATEDGVIFSVISGMGDVTAAANIADNRLLRGDGGLKGIQESGITVSDTDDLTGIGSISLTGTVDGRDVATDGSKLDGVESLADVTDTANVTAAGALMDSEVDADLKTLVLPASTTISAFGATLVDDIDAPTARTTLGVDPIGTDNSTDVTLAGTPDYITIVGQVITRNTIVATTDLSATGTKDSTTFLRGDDTWDVPPGGSGGQTDTVTGGTGITNSGNDVNATLDHDAHTGDVTGATALTIANNVVANANMAIVGPNTVKGNPGPAPTNPSDISIVSNTVLGRQAGNIVSAQVATAQVADDAVTYAKIQDVTQTDVLLGRDTAGAGIIEEIGPAAGRTLLNVDVAGTDNSTDVTLAGTPDYITLVGQVLTRNLIVATTDLSATGTKDSTTFLRGDDTWDVPTGGVTSTDPVDVTKAAAAVGVSSEAARQDHKHDVTTAAPVALAVVVGGSASEGTATTLARSDHTHQVTAPPAPEDVTKSGALTGIALTVARSDHKHDVATAAPVTISTANVEGTSSSLARADHQHDHGMDADIQTLVLPANTTISAFGATLVDDADAATARTTLGVDAAGTDNSTDVTLAGTPDYITITGQVITRNLIVATTDLSATGTKDSTTFLRGDDTWDVPAGGGDVTAAANLGDNFLIRGDGAVKGVQNSGITVSDTDDLSGIGNITLTGTVDGVDIATRDHDAVTVAGTPDYITLSGQVLTRNQIDMAADVTGVLPTANIADNAITLDKLAGGTAGNLITYDASGDPAAVATGTSTHVLTSNGAGVAPTFQAAPSGNIDHTGDVTSSGAPATVVALGTTGASVNVNSAAPPTTGQVLEATSATTATWQTPAAGGGDVSSTGTTSLAGEIAAYSDTGQKTIGRSEFRIGTTTAGTGTRTISGGGAIAGGTIATGGTIAATMSGAVALGYVSQATGTASMTASGNGSFATGFASSATSGSAVATHEATANGAFCSGYVDSSSAATAKLSASGQGSCVIGRVSGGGATLQATTLGAFVGGAAQSSGTVESVSNASGSFVHGLAENSGILRATTGAGCFVSGYCDQSGSSIIASGIGSACIGAADNLVSGQGNISASGIGSFAGGYALGFAGTGTISATQLGSFVWGYTGTGNNTCSATAANAVQFGIGTNSTSDSLQVGNTVKIRGASAATADGEIGEASGDISIGSSGQITTFTYPNVTGSTAGNAALQNLLTALAGMNLIQDSTT